MNQKPEIGRYDDAGAGPGTGRTRLRRGPPAGWRMATMASSLLVLSAVAGMASLLAGAILLLPLAALTAPFLLRRRLNRNRGNQAREAAVSRGGIFTARWPRFYGT